MTRERDPMSMRPSLARFSLLAAALAMAAAACQLPRETPPPAEVTEPAPTPPREPIPVAPPVAVASQDLEPMIDRGTGTFVRSPPGPSTAAVTRNAAGEVTLNVVDADVREVVRMVLQDALGANYVIDPGVQGTITVQTSEPVPASDLVPILDAVLRVNGAALVRAGDLFKVVPVEAAISSGPRPAIRPRPEAGAPGFGIQVVPLQFATAAEVAELLAPFAPPGGALQVDPDRNLLLLAGSPDELNTLSELVAMFDVDWLAGMSFGLFPLKQAAPTDLVAELEQVFGGPEAGPLAGVVRFVPIERLNAVLAISAQPGYLDRVRTWIERLDRTGNGGEEGVYVYPVQNGRAADLAAVLSEIFDIRTATVGPSDLLAPGLEAGEISSTGFELGRGDIEDQDQGDEEPPVGRRPVRPGLGRAPGMEFAPARGGLQEGEIRVIADDTTNSLVIRATARDYRKIQEALRQLDIMRLQVLIEATIAEVALEGQLRFGVEWFFRFGDFSATFSRLSAAAVPGPFPGAVTGQLPGFSALLANADVRVILNALEQVTDVNVISSPQLLVLDNQTARLQVGDQVPIATQSAVSITDPDAPVVNSIEQRDTGVILSVTPRVNASGLVFMEIEEETSDVVPTTTSNIDSPTIRQRRVSSTVAVQSGETVVLGGLIQDDIEEAQTGIPVLHRLPIVGPLFGVTDNRNRRTELLVVITPRVIRNPDQARAVTEELRQRLRGLAPLDARVR